ncbi:hypothetical protein BS50DRAFT_347775 [Corynespora cassiicola Philippines]|uniref:Uncharacterized protein n=1 Tax=Corynespora cassiicola Philippines TaxID=1448308 RepID=A0A2T2NRK1_CORCC|nr:hypothetical protein BS50DRAFT_347775 [Corynespora cassiicola Philippines]
MSVDGVKPCTNMLKVLIELYCRRKPIPQPLDLILAIIAVLPAIEFCVHGVVNKMAMGLCTAIPQSAFFSSFVLHSRSRADSSALPHWAEILDGVAQIRKAYPQARLRLSGSPCGRIHPEERARERFLDVVSACPRRVAKYN